MTEKRFTTVELPMPTIWGIWYDGAYLSTNRICMLLNEYIDVRNENEQLKSRVGYLERKIDRERISHQKQHEKWEEEIQKENEQLKSKIKLINKDLTQIMLILLDDEIVSKLTETELKAFERLSQFKGDME